MKTFNIVNLCYDVNLKQIVNIMVRQGRAYGYIIRR